MTNQNISAKGERAAIAGYLPQFKAFAQFAYRELINDNLEWIKVADPEADKLDDVQYATPTEVHAYQIKWSINNDRILYGDFVKLLPLIARSWKAIKALPSSVGKKVIPYLLTNKPLTTSKTIKVNGTAIGSFTNFYEQVWKDIKQGKQLDNNWSTIADELQTASGLSDGEYQEFIKCFQFQVNFVPKELTVNQSTYLKQGEDLQRFTDFIIEKVASPDRPIKFTYKQIIQELGWENRFKTTFNHDLIVDLKRYQPIQATIDSLNIKIDNHKKGYIFLLGGPGTGKSTLLTQWSQDRNERVIRYYAFDFINTIVDEEERGEAKHLLFDLVFQIKNQGIYTGSVLPYKDILYLKDVFYQQIEALGQDYQEKGEKVIIIIDGLDHVPREYTSISKSFLKELPKPDALPEGVYIILGSQTYDLDDLGTEIKKGFMQDERTIKIDSFSKDEIDKYLEISGVKSLLTEEQVSFIYDKSQGHPLYLTYIVGNIQQSSDISQTLQELPDFDDDIDNYYQKIWKPISSNMDLVQLLGLMGRIKGSINPKFVKEWRFNSSILVSFKKLAKSLFNDNGFAWSFFHNSFRQFLLKNTAIDLLGDDFDSTIAKNYHRDLANFYSESSVEPSWNSNYHLFKAGLFNEFTASVTPEAFHKHYLSFRPLDEIKQDIRLGLEIARKCQDVRLLVRYLLILTELKGKAFYINPLTLTEELLTLNKPRVAQNYLRSENSLKCSLEYAFEASRLFIEYGYHNEGEALYNLAYPKLIQTLKNAKEFNNYDQVDLVNILTDCISVMAYLTSTTNILEFIDSIQNHIQKPKSLQGLEKKLLRDFLGILIIRQKWDDLELILEELYSKKIDQSLFIILLEAIDNCLYQEDLPRAKKYLDLLLRHCQKERLDIKIRLEIANQIHKITTNLDLVSYWIQDIPQPSIIKNNEYLEHNWEDFRPLILLNKLLHLVGKGVPITTAIPDLDSSEDSEKEILVGFGRMLCLMAQVLADGLQKKQLHFNIKTRVCPIVEFYYKDFTDHNSYWFRITGMKNKYFNLLIQAVATFSSIDLKSLATYLFEEFKASPKYWPSDVQRSIIESLYNNDFDKKVLKTQLIKIEDFMLVEKDVTGRQDECIEQAGLWLKLGEDEFAEKWLKQALKESSGIGYRKDYQYNSWIDWLRIVNRQTSEKAPERIQWFLSHLRHLKESTEKSAYLAAEGILEATFEWDFYAGTNLSQWLLDEGYIGFHDAMEIFIKQYLKLINNEESLKAIVLLYTEVFLFTAIETLPLLLKEILGKGYSISQENFFKKYLPIIIKTITHQTLEETRPDLLSTVDEFVTNLGFQTKSYYSSFLIPKSQNSSNNGRSNKLRTNGGDYFSEAEVLRKVTNVASFIDLIQQEDETNSYFNWEKVIEKIEPEFTEEDIKQVLSLARNRRRKKSEFYSQMSGIAKKSGNIDLAQELAEEALLLSSDSGWDTFYDGGSRLKAIDALKKINPVAASKKAFEVFSHDILKNEYAYSYARSLDDILPAITTDFDAEEVWSEIFDYVQRLMANSTPIPNLPAINSKKQPALETLIDYLLYLSNNVTNVIKEKSKKLLAVFAHEGSPIVIERLKLLNTTETSSVELLNDILMLLLALKSPKLQEFRETVTQLAISKDYLIRMNAVSILQFLKEPIPTPKQISLPQLYNLHLGETTKLITGEEQDPYFPKVKVDDPEDLLRVFDMHINYLSKLSDIAKNNIIQRAYHWMKQLGKPEQWTVEYEKEIRYILEEIRLNYSFNRPRVLVAREALMMVVGELIDAGQITEKDLWKQLYTFYDYNIPFFPEVIKPSFIPLIKVGGLRFTDKDWVNKANNSPRITENTLNKYNNDLHVIGEYTITKTLDWGTPTETYMAQLTIKEELDKNSLDFFGNAFQASTEDYHKPRDFDDYIIIIRNHRYMQASIKPNWIGINPVLARYLGWSKKPQNLFAWQDKDGIFMAKSIYWSNGNMGMQPPHLYSEAGEGWLVVVSDIALEQIKEVNPYLYIHQKLTRSKYEDSKLIGEEAYGFKKYK